MAKVTTPYLEIVDPNSIGKKENPIKLNDVLSKADAENLTPVSQMAKKVIVIGIDEQLDFMPDGALGVPNADKDVERFTKFIYDNMDEISKIAVSIDTHIPHQIFHPCWWIDKNGNHPAPYTEIKLADLDKGNYRAVIKPIESRDYVMHLEQDGKKTLVVWPYHCIQGTTGCSLDNQFSNMVYFHSVAKKSIPITIVKGQDPLSEMYGIIRPEYDTKGYVNIAFLNLLANYDMIIIGGEAKSHCVLETIKQILEHFANQPEITNKIYILEDCMSSIPGFEDITNATFDDFRKIYGVHIVKSTDLKL
jgi:nicotinamidase-related amidase